MGASAGRVLLIPKGDWNAETTYTGLDWVRHNGVSWVCKNTCTNIEPTEANSDNWQIMSRDGTQITVDTEISDESENPVQNKVVTAYIDARKSAQGQNLIPYPYYRPDSYTSNGITWTVNEDGSITANGTATATSFYSIFIGQLGLEIGKHYTLTLISVGGPISLFIANANNQNQNTDIAVCRRANGSTIGVVFPYSQIDDFDHDQIGLYVGSGTTLTNCVVKFQLERGTVRHEYQPTTLSNTTLKEKIDGIKIPEIAVDAAMSDQSTNPVQNKVIKEYVDNHVPAITVDSAVSDASANPVQNKVIKAYVDSKKIPTFGIENIFTGTPFCVDSAGLVNTTTTWAPDNGGYQVDIRKYTAGGIVNLSLSLSLPANSIAIINVNTLNQENIMVQGSFIKYNFTNAAANEHLSISFTGRSTAATSGTIRYMPLVIHLG